MTHLTTQHLDDLKKAHISRLQALELQAAQFGVECPAHISIEIKQIEDNLLGIEQQLANMSIPQQYILLDKFKAKSRVRAFWIALVVVAIIGVLDLVQVPFRISADRNQNLNPASNRADATEPNLYRNRIICHQEVVTTFLVAGLVVRQNSEIEIISLSIENIGSNLRIQCYNSQSGEVQLVISNRP